MPGSSPEKVPPLDALVETAVGVLGDNIDFEGTGWNGEPWFMLATFPAGEQALMTFTPAGDTLADQLSGVGEVFRDELPVACAYVRPGDGSSEARLVALDGRGGQRTVICEVFVADDGREAIAPVEGVEVPVLPGRFESFVADALALARRVRAGDEPAAAWDDLLRRARSVPG